MHVVRSSITVRDTSSSSSTMGMDQRREAVEKRHTLNFTAFCLKYTDVFYINTCSAHGVVHNNNM